jgi:shikimate dehydrogenase
MPWSSTRLISLSTSSRCRPVVKLAMETYINKDTQLCMSLSARPGNFETRFHNFLYRNLRLNFVYRAFTTRDLPAAIGGIRALGIRGCAVSRPNLGDRSDVTRNEVGRPPCGVRSGETLNRDPNVRKGRL